MKAMILAAGFGTRLRPYTDYTPKPLFTIAGRPLLDIIIHRLMDAGCEALIINTHHLHRKIQRFITDQSYPIPVFIRYEPEILGTGGAIKNVADFWDQRPIMVVNGDVYSDIDLKEVYKFHGSHRYPATLVCVDDPEFNTVCVDQNGFVRCFLEPGSSESCTGSRALTFTGIQVIDPQVLAYIPDGIFANSIDSYRKMLSCGLKIKACRPLPGQWRDLGTAARYRTTVLEKMLPEAFRRAFGKAPGPVIRRLELKGDGSARQWYRLVAGRRTLILADHGIRCQNDTSEAEAFVNIGLFLHQRGICVPKIHFYDTFAGLIFLEDVGDTHLQTLIQDLGDPEKIMAVYKRIIDQLAILWTQGARGFNTDWTCQSPTYSPEVILEKECRYFVEAFLNGFLGLEAKFEDYLFEFSLLAQKALEHPALGFMHRDFQSRNIMVKNNKIYFIDFQGGRIGPLPYDLASLLIDPYVDLPPDIQQRLLNYAVRAHLSAAGVSAQQFHRCYRYCAIARNLQILGAFGYLSTVGGKAYFKKYIPAAVRALENNLAHSGGEFPGLTAVVQKISDNPKIRRQK